MSKYLLKYRSFESLMADVTDDLELYESEGLIDPSKYIKVARKINSDLGLDIQQEKEELLKVENYKANLPNDFYLLNFALICFKDSTTIELPYQHFEDVEVDRCIRPEVKLCECPTVQTNECGGKFKVVQKIKTHTVEFTNFDLLRISNKSKKYCSSGCFNLDSDSINNAQIKDDYIYTNFQEGSIYINYMGVMEDEDGGLLVLDHPLVNDYYEYAIKSRILENIVLNKDATVYDQYVITKELARQERTRALLLINMPEYGDIQEAIKYNRRRAYNRYYKYFS